MSTTPYRIDDAMTAPERLEQLELLVQRGMGSSIVRRLAMYAHSMAGVAPSKVVLASTALRIAQRAGYRSDPANEEWFQPVSYTAEHGGDCEDLAALVVALLRLLEFRAELVWIDYPQARYNHVTARVWIDGQPLWADASICGARLGEEPNSAMRRLGAWFVVNPAGTVSAACPPA